MADDTLLALTSAYIDQASAFFEAELQGAREKALRYYDGENPDGMPITPGRSKVVDPVVKDTIEWVMPQLMRIFTSGDRYISVDPHGPEDADKARKTDAWLNYVITRENNGYLQDYQWVRDALLEKVGWQKVFWEIAERTEKHTFEGLAEMELEALRSAPDVAISGVRKIDGGDGMPLYSATITVTKRTPKLRLETLPPEEVLYLEDATADRDSWWFIAHKRHVRISDLRELGYDVADDINGAELDSVGNDERMADAGYDDDYDDGDTAAGIDPAARKVWFYECYMRHDRDGDGIAEWLMVARVGDEILAIEEIEEAPLAFLSPILRSHRLTGYSIAELVFDLQELFTALHRAINDHLYLTVNPRSEVDVTGVTEHTAGDLLDNRAGGWVRVRRPGTINPLQMAPLPPHAFQVLEHWTQKLETRTGVARYNQGLSPDALNKTATGVTAIMDAANARIELIARTMAETGFRDRANLIIHLSAKHPDLVAQKTIKLSGQPLQLSADDLHCNYDLIVNTGIGTGNRAQQMMLIDKLLTYYQTLMQVGAGPGSPAALFNSQNVYNALSEGLRLGGYRNIGDFLIDPMDPNAPRDPVQPPSPSVEQILAEAEAKKAEVNAMETQMKAQLEGQKTQLDAQKSQQDVQVQVAKLQLEQQSLALKERELALKEYQMRAETNAKLIEAQGASDEKAVSGVVDLEREMWERGMRERELALKEREAMARALQAQPQDDYAAAIEALAEKVDQLAQVVTAPKTFERDDSGKVVSINGAPVMRDANGLIVGVGSDRNNAAAA